MLAQHSEGFSSCFCGHWEVSLRSPTSNWESAWPLSPHLDVQLESFHRLLQHGRPLLLGQLHAVHPAPVQLLEAVGAAHAGEGEERQPLFAAQPQRFLGDFPQHLTARQIAKVAGVGVGNEQLRVLFANLKQKGAKYAFRLILLSSPNFIGKVVICPGWHS